MNMLHAPIKDSVALKIRTLSGSEIEFAHINTTNPKKLEEFRAAGLILNPCSIEIDELQPNDHHNTLIKKGAWKEASLLIAEDKANRAFQKLGQPILVEDTSMFLSAAPHVTGPLIKQWLQNPIGLTQLCLLAASTNDYDATAYFTLAVANGTDVASWTLEIPGKISLAPKGESGFGWDPIFIPEPQKQKDLFGPELKTYAELTAEQIQQIAPRRAQVVDLLRMDLK